MLLSQSFYNRPTIKVAKDLLGCFLVRRLGSSGLRAETGTLKFKIVETEAYIGPNDLASHASRGRTERNGVMFGPPGIIYVYFTYGMHYMLNIVTEEEGYPAAVLIRAVKPPQMPISCHSQLGWESRVNKTNFASSPSNNTCTNRKSEITNLKFNGPARLTKSLQIDKSFNHLPIFIKKHNLWIESCAEELKPSRIMKTTRVGVGYAKEYKEKKWRFYVKGNEFISKK